MKEDRSRGATLVHLLCTEGDDEDWAYELLDEFYDGFPVDRLAPLLRSDSSQAVETGAWIATELGPRVRALLPLLEKLLGHASPLVRSHCVEAILIGASRQTPRSVASVVALLDDTDELIRWRVLDFLMLIEVGVLAAALECVSDAKHAEAVRWMLAALDADPDPTEVAERLGSEEWSLRASTTVVAARVFSRIPSLLALARACPDQDIADFLDSEFRMGKFEAT